VPSTPRSDDRVRLDLARAKRGRQSREFRVPPSRSPTAQRSASQGGALPNRSETTVGPVDQGAPANLSSPGSKSGELAGAGRGPESDAP
jgi:hypothetical protein